MAALSRVAAARAADNAHRAVWGLAPARLPAAEAARMAEHYALEAMRADSDRVVSHLGAAKAATLAADCREQAAYYRAMTGEAA